MSGRCRRGRPRTSPRLLLDAILWKIATGHSWDELPACFPPLRLCSNYYRRLYRSGRWVTLMLALYNHFCTESSTDILTFLKQGVFTTTPLQKITLNPQIRPTWENCTALLFMQLARSAWSHFQRNHKRSHPLYPLSPVFRGTAQLTTGLPPGFALPKSYRKSVQEVSSQPSSRTSFVIQPIEDSFAWKKWQKI